MFRPFKLKNPIGEAYSMGAEDTLSTKKALARLGHMDVPDYGLDEYPDRPMLDAVKSFQRANALLEDGVMKPGGETEARMNTALTNRSKETPAANGAEKKPAGGEQVAMARRRRPGDAGAATEGVMNQDLFIGGGAAGLSAAAAAKILMDQNRDKTGIGGEVPPQPAPSNRQMIDKPFPPTPGYEPPDTPLPDRTESLPQAPLSPALKGRPIDEVIRTEPMIFQEISDELRRELSRPMESHRGDEYTERGEDITFNELLPEVLQEYEDEVRNWIEHKYGALDNEGNRKPQEHLPGRGPGHRYSSNPDGTLLNKKTGSRLRLNTANMLKDGETPEAKERRQLLQARDNSKLSDMVAALPKLRPGMDETEFRVRTKKMLKEAIRRWIGTP